MNNIFTEQFQNIPFSIIDHNGRKWLIADVTERYIELLKINQKDKVRITRTVEAQVLDLKTQGMSQADIARLLRISTASVSLIIKGCYKFAPEESEKPLVSIEALLEQMTAEEQGKLGGAE